MKHILFLLISLTLLISCSDDETKPEVSKDPEIEELVEIKDGKFTDYYPGKKQIKFQGMQDDEGQRHGKWSFYDEKGTEISTTFYDHGKKHGHCIVKYPSGAIHYYGEYHYDKMIGIWKTYDESGKLQTEKDYGPVE